MKGHAIRNMLLAAVASGAMAASASAATIINLDGVDNTTQTDSSKFKTIALQPGTYSLTFVEDQYKSFSRWSKETGCDGAGLHCTQGWENSARYVIDGVTYSFGDGSASGGYGPIAGEDAWFKTADLAFDNAQNYLAKFTLTAPTDVSFYIYDNKLDDNRGGVSLRVAAVPEPATWAMLIAGFGMIGLAARRRRQTSLPTTSC